MDDLFLAVALVLLFVTVFMALEGLYVWWNSRRGPEAVRLAKRLRMISAGGHADVGTTVLKQRLMSNTPAIERLLLRIPRIGSLDKFLVQTGTNWSVSNLLVNSAGLFATGLFGMLLFRQPLTLSLLAGLAAGLLPTLYLLRARSLRLKRFESLLPEALDLIGRALRAGHSLPSALQVAGAELPPPIGEEFQQAFDEINFGISTGEALNNLAARVPSTDLAFFVIAVLIQRETGGNLAEILGNISSIIRERLKLMGKVRALSAEGRFSGIVLTLLPFGVAGLLYMIDPDFMSTLWRDPTGINMIYGGLIFIAIGIVWMRKIIRIRV